jgi:hypothetical protein
MTRQITLSLDLNENDLDALKAVLAPPRFWCLFPPPPGLP